MSSRVFFCVGILTVGLLFVAGCGERGPKTVPVYGTVTFVGREAPTNCRLFFKPIKTEGIIRPSACERAADGSYKVKAFSTSKGLIPGTYRIEVTYYDLKPGKSPNLETSWAETNYDAGEVVVNADSGGIEHNIEVPKKG